MKTNEQAQNDPAMWQRALSTVEVAELYELCLDGFSASPVEGERDLWPFPSDSDH